MKGLVFNLLRDVVEAEDGPDAWDDVLRDAGSDGVHTSLGAYPDAELRALVRTVADRLGTPPGELLRWFGRRALPRLAAQHPQFFERHASTLPFLLSLNDVIHPEVRKLHPGAEPPEFGFELPDARTLHMHYASPRRLCGLAEGFVVATAEHYGESVEVDQPRCMLRGDERCVLRVRFER